MTDPDRYPGPGSPSGPRPPSEADEDPFTAGSQMPPRRSSMTSTARRTSRSPGRTRFVEPSFDRGQRRSSAFTAGDRSPTTSGSAGTGSPEAYDSRSLLGILNPPPRRTGRERKRAEGDEDEEDEEGPPASLMMGAASPPSPRRSPSRTPRAATRSPPGSRSRSPSPSITRHHHTPTAGPSTSKRPSSRNLVNAAASPRSSPSNGGGLAMPPDSPSSSQASDEGRTDEAYSDAAGVGAEASTAFVQGAKGHRRRNGEEGEGAGGIGGLFARAKAAWDQERQAWGGGQARRLWTDEEEVDEEAGEGLPLATGGRRRKGKSRRTTDEGVHLADSAPSARTQRSWWTRPAAGANGGERGLSGRERALWRWVNVDDLDAFLQEVYMYYSGRGIWVIGLSKLLTLMTIGFVIGFSTFLLGCVDYSILRQSHHLSTVIVPRCVSRFSGVTLLIFLCFAGFYVWRVLKFGQTVARLLRMKEFYEELLEIPDSELATVPWHAIVDKLSALRASHPSGTARPSYLASAAPNGVLRLDAHDVANRIMREENYLIALFNDAHVLDLRPPFRVPGWLLGDGPRMSRTLEWNLVSVLEGFAFDEQGQVKAELLVASRREELAEQLGRRFMSMGLLNAIFVWFIVPYLLMYSFLRYFEEYHANPSSMGSRNFTQLARWRFREFNELPHIFRARLARSYDASRRYVDQFPKAKTALLARFVAFVAGSFAAVLLVLSVYDPDAFLHFELVDGGSVVFFLGVFGGVVAVARGMAPKEEHASVDVADLVREIALHTHYLPPEWRGRLHSVEVHREFSALFQMRLVIFFQELLSVLVTPFVLSYSLPRSSLAIVDFYRTHTVHVDGLGHICSFAAFDFARAQGAEEGRLPVGETPSVGIDSEARSPRLAHPHQRTATSESRGKMEKSLLSFQAHHPNWEPSNQTASLYLSRMTADMQSFAPTGQHFRSGGARGTSGGMGRSRMTWGGSGRSGGVHSMAFAPAAAAAAGAGGARMSHGLGLAPMQRSAIVSGHHHGSEASQAAQARIGRSAVGPRFFGRDLGVEAIDEEEPEEGPVGAQQNNGSNGRTTAWTGDGQPMANGSAQVEPDSSVDGKDDADDPFGVKSSPATSSSSPPASRKEPTDGPSTGMGAMLGEVWQRQMGKW